jgi:glycosyltransferase involved in cell wall biosynthesis
MRPCRILTWHVHGSYLYYLSHVHHDFYLPVKPDRLNPYGGRTPSYPWPANIHEVPADEVHRRSFDCILYQSHANYLLDQHELLSEEQRHLPRIFLEHDPPRQHPTDTRHPVDDKDVLLVHCTHFNNLMWDSGHTPTRVIDHGVIVPEDVLHTGERQRGIVVMNNIKPRGRRLGWDVFQRVRAEVPLDYVGMGWEDAAGIGEVPHRNLARFCAPYRFFFNPIRYTSLGLSILEAMMIGMPIIGLATTELVTVIQNGVSGHVATDVCELIDVMQDLLRDPAEARRLGEGARRMALERFTIERFVRDWEETFALVVGRPGAYAAPIPRVAAPVGGTV